MNEKDEPTWPVWQRRIADAIGPNIGDANSRMHFGESVLRGLATALPRGRNKQERERDLAKLAAVTSGLRDAMARFRSAQAPLIAKMLHSQAAFRAGHESINFEQPDAYLAAWRASDEEQSRAPPRPAVEGPPARGPSTVWGLKLATTIARAYAQHFARPPASSKDHKTPYDRACLVVNELLAAIGLPVQIRETARARDPMVNTRSPRRRRANASPPMPKTAVS
jgi:hypothetical protein